MAEPFDACVNEHHAGRGGQEPMFWMKKHQMNEPWIRAVLLLGLTPWGGAGER